MIPAALFTVCLCGLLVAAIEHRRRAAKTDPRVRVLRLGIGIQVVAAAVVAVALLLVVHDSVTKVFGPLF